MTEGREVNCESYDEDRKAKQCLKKCIYEFKIIYKNKTVGCSSFLSLVSSSVITP